MTNSNETPSINPNQQEKHHLVSASVDMPGSSKEVVVSMDGKDIIIKPFDEKNIDTILLKLLKENDQLSQGVGINDAESTAVKIKGKKKKIEKDIQTLKEIFSPANHEIFMVSEESVKDLPEKPDLCAMIIASKAETLKANLVSAGYNVKPDGERGFKAESGDIKLYFLFGKEQHHDEKKENSEDRKQAA